MTLVDDFRGDNAHLIRSIESLLSLDEAGALVPHGVGGHAKSLLSAAAVRLASTPSPSDVIEKCGEALSTIRPVILDVFKAHRTTGESEEVKARDSATAVRNHIAAAIRQLASKKGQHHGQG